LIKQVAQTGIIKAFRQRRWRKLMSVLVLLLLFTNQTWAGGLCFCESEGKAPNSDCHTMLPLDKPKAEAPHSGCHTAHVPGQTTATPLEVATPPLTHHCSDAESSLADAQPGQLTHSTMICCHLQPDAEAQAVPVTAQNQVLIVAILPFIHFGARPNSAPLSHTFHHPHQKRPLYLSYSCLLI
jgi:hypothetical protein